MRHQVDTSPAPDSTGRTAAILRHSCPTSPPRWRPSTFASKAADRKGGRNLMGVSWRLATTLAVLLIAGPSGPARAEEQSSALDRLFRRSASDSDAALPSAGSTFPARTWPSRLWHALSPQRSLERMARGTRAVWRRIVPADRGTPRQPIRRTNGRRGGSSASRWNLSRLWGGRPEPAPPKTVQEWIAQERINP